MSPQGGTKKGGEEEERGDAGDELVNGEFQK